MQLGIKKSKILNNSDFHMLTVINPTLAEKMMRNRYHLRGSKHGHTKKVREALDWLATEIDGVVYVSKENTSKFFDMHLYFENDSDAVAFKLLIE